MSDSLPIDVWRADSDNRVIFYVASQGHRLLPITNSKLHWELIQPIPENPETTLLDHSVVD